MIERGNVREMLVTVHMWYRTVRTIGTRAKQDGLISRLSTVGKKGDLTRNAREHPSPTPDYAILSG